MSDPAGASLMAPADRVVRLYSAAMALSLIGIFLLSAYAIHLGPILGPGVESSFGLAVAVMFLLGALAIHLVDRVYREWPLGRKFRAEPGAPLDDAAIATFLKAVVAAAIVGAIIYVFWGLLAS